MKERIISMVQKDPDGTDPLFKKLNLKQWKDWECRIMSAIDFRYWFCECHWRAPYGRVISADCEWHD